MICKVYYESWQMDCCGETFALGSAIEWTVCRYKEAGECQTVDLGYIDYCYENHLFDRGPYYDLEGKVIDIMILYEKHEPSKDQPSMSLPVSGVLQEASKVDRYEKGYNGMTVSGYVVTIQVTKVETAKW